MIWPPSYLKHQEPLANHTSLRIGGPAEYFCEPSTLDELISILRESVRMGFPVSVIGGGTNTLVSDRGVRGLVLHLGSGFRSITIISKDDEPVVRIRCGAAVPTRRIVVLGSKRGWGGLDSFAGVPGQISGAVCMNAQGIGRFIKRVSIVSFDGALREFSREQLKFGYRCAAIEPGIVVEVVLEFPKAPREEVTAQIKRALERRNKTQETALPSAGCTFKNPAGYSAGKLIDQAGLKGTRIGDALVSTRHANFIVNVGSATCEEVLSLMEYIQWRVARERKIKLDPEVRFIGEQWGSSERRTTNDERLRIGA